MMSIITVPMMCVGVQMQVQLCMLVNVVIQVK